MQASMSEVVLPLDGRDDEELRHSTEMDQIGSSCRDESQLSSQIDDETLEDVDIVIDHALVQYFGTTLPSVTPNEHQPSPPPRVTRDEVPVEQELSKTSEPKSFSIDCVEPNLVAIDRYGSAIDSNWDETETDFNYYLPNYAQEVVITTETNSPQASEKEPSERLVTAPADYSLDVIVPEKLGVQGFPFEEALNPLTSTANPNPLQEESAFFDDMDLNPAGLKDCRSFYEAQTAELSGEGSPENVSPGCSSMHIVPMSEGMLEVATQSPPEELVGSVGLDVVGKNVIVEMNPTASPDVARVPCSNPVCQPMSPPPSYRQTMAAAYQKTIYDPLSCCGPYGNVVKNKIVLSYSGDGVMSENDSRDSDYGPPKLDAIDDSHASTNDQPNDYPPMLEPADPAFSPTSKVATHVIPSAAGEALESIRKLSLGVVPENNQEILEGSSQDELNECLGKLVPSITPEFSKEIPSGYIVNDMYNVRNITPESSTIASCVDDVGGLPDLLPVSEEPKSYRTFNRISPKKKKHESTENAGTSSQTKSVEGGCNLPESPNKPLIPNSNRVQSLNESTSIVGKKEPSASTSGVEKIGPITRVVKVAKSIPQQALSALIHDDGTGRANFKIIKTTATTINLGEKKLTIVKPQGMKDKIVLLKHATVKKILPSDFESVPNLKKLTSVQSCNIEKVLLSRTMPDSKCLLKTVEPKNLPTSSVSSNSVLQKEAKDDVNPSTVKGTSKAAVSKNSVALKVSLPLDLLSVKPTLVPDSAKKVASDKGDEPIEKAVTADGDVDPNAVMDAMKVSVPYLFPVTKPEVTKITKPDVGKTDQPPNLLKEKKKSAAPPVVVKMTSKANRRIFSPIREVDFSIEKSKSLSIKRPESSLIKVNDGQTMKPELKGNSDKLVLSQPPSANEAIIGTANVLSAGNTINSVFSKEEGAVRTELAKEDIVQSVSNDLKKTAVEPSLMKHVDSASDDLSSFLSSLSGPKEPPKGVQTLEKAVYETIIAASARDVGVKSVTSSKADPANDPIIIPPVAFRNDDPLSLKVGLKPCKFRDVKKGEPSKKYLNSQGTRPVPTSARSNMLPSSKQPNLLRREPLPSKNSMDPLPPISASETAIVHVEESSSKNKDVQIDYEEKVHPIVELVNQLIESNSKSPQFFNDPDKTRSEEMVKKSDETKALQGITDTQKALARNEEIRAKEDGILAGVVNKRTSKLIQKARDMVCGDVHVESNCDVGSNALVVKTRSYENSLAAEPVRQSKVTALEKLKNNDLVFTAEITLDGKSTKPLEGSSKTSDLPLRAPNTGEAVEKLVGDFLDTPTPNLPKKKPVAPLSSVSAKDGANVCTFEESRSSPPIVLFEKNLPSECELVGSIKVSVPGEIASDQQDSGSSVSEGKVPKEKKTVKTKDLRSPPKITDPSVSAPPLVETSNKPPNYVEQTDSQLRRTEVSISVGILSKDLKEGEKKESFLKTTDLPKTLSSPVNGRLLKQTKAQDIEKPLIEEPKTAAAISVSIGENSGELKENSEIIVKRSNRPQANTDPAGKASKDLTVCKVKGNDFFPKTPDLYKNTSTDVSNQPSESINKAAGPVSAHEVLEDVNDKNPTESRGSLDTDDSLKKAPSNTTKCTENPKLLHAGVGQTPPKTDVASKETKSKKEEGRKVLPKTTGSSKKVTPSTEKLPTQLIVSIPTVAISNQPCALDVLIPANGTKDESKGETGHDVKSAPENVNLSAKEPLKRAEVSLHDTKLEQEAVLIPSPVEVKSKELNQEKTVIVKESSANTSEIVPPVKVSLPPQQTVPAAETRSLSRRKSRSEVPISTSAELKGKGGENSVEKDSSLDRCPNKSAENLIASNPIQKVSQNTSTAITSSQNVRHEPTDDMKGAVKTLAENKIQSSERHSTSKKAPEKTSHRMRTRGSVPTPTSFEEDESNVEGQMEPDKTVGTVDSEDNDDPKPDTILKHSKITTNDKSISRPRTRSETVSEKKVDGLTENLENVTSVSDNEPEGMGKKPRGENIAPSSVSQSAAAPTPKAVELKQEINDTPNASVRTRGKIERKPATVKPIPATPKKACSKLLGNPNDDFDELDNFSSQSDKKLESIESAEVVTELRGRNDGKTISKTPISTRRSSSHKNKIRGSTETNAKNCDDSAKPPSVQKSISNRLSRNMKHLTPKKNVRVSMKPKKVSKLKSDVKNQVNDVYDFTDDEDQSIKMQTIDHYRKISGKSGKNLKCSIARFDMSQESLLSDDDNRINQNRVSRNETSKIIPGKAKRRASPRKSVSEPRNSETKKGVDITLKNVSSESTDSLLSNSSEAVLPAELQENLKNSRNESIRLAKEKRLKKSPVGKLSTSADLKECAPQPSSTRGTRRSSGSRTPLVENSITDKDQKDLVSVIGPGSKSEATNNEVKPKMEISTRETRRSSVTSSTSGDKPIDESDKIDTVQKEIAKVVTSDRKRSPHKKDLNVVDKLSQEKISEHSSVALTVGIVNDLHSRPDGDSTSHISTRSKSRESISEDDTSPRALRNKGLSQTNPVVGSEPKFPKNGESKSVTKSSEDVLKVRHKITKNIQGIQVSESSKLDSSSHEQPIKSISNETGGSVIAQSSSNRMVTRSSCVPSSRPIENEVTGNTDPKPSSIPDEGTFLPKLRSSVNKRVDVSRKTDHEAIDVQSTARLEVGPVGNVSEVLPDIVESVGRSIAPDKLKKTKNTDPLLFDGSKDNQFPDDHINESVNTPTATSDITGKEKHRRAKKGGAVVGGLSDMILGQSGLLTQDIAALKAEAVSLKTPPMDSTAAQEVDNIQPVGAMSQHGEPEGAKSSTRTAQLRSLDVPLVEDGCTARNSIGLFRKKNKKLVVEKKNLGQSDDKQVVGEVITRKANDAIIKSGNKRLSVNCLDPPVKFDARRTHFDNEVVSKPSFSLSDTSHSDTKKGETSKISNHTNAVHSDLKSKSTRRITRSCLSSSSPTLDSKTLRSSSKAEQECVPSNQNRLSHPTLDLARTEIEPCGSKVRKHTCLREASNHALTQISPSDPVKETSYKSEIRSSSEDEEGRRSEKQPMNDLLHTSGSRRNRKPKAPCKYSDLHLGGDEITFAQPKPLKVEKGKGKLGEVVTPGSPSEENVPNLGRSMTQGNNKTSTKKDIMPKPTPYCMLPKVGRVKTTTKDVCEISGEAEKLFEEASLDGKEGFDVIVPSPGKSPDSTTQHSAEIIIPALSAELDDLPNSKISEDAHGVTSTSELGNVLNGTERDMLVLSQGFQPDESSTKREDESVSSTTVDSTKILESNEAESSLDHLIPLKEDLLPGKLAASVVRSNNMGNLKVMAKRPKFIGETISLIPEHPKKIWRVNPVLDVPSTPPEITPRMIGSLERQVSCVVKPHISDEELKKTPLKKRQVWAYSSSCNSNRDTKSKLVGDPIAINSTNDLSPSSGIPKSFPVVVGSSNILPEKEAAKNSNTILCTGTADGTCSPTSLVDLLPHSICNILAAPTDKLVTNESTAETPSQEAESPESTLTKTKKEKMVGHNTRSESRERLIDRRKSIKKRRAGMSLRSSRNRIVGKRHLLARNRWVKAVGKRCKIVQKTKSSRKMLKTSPSPESLPLSNDIVKLLKPIISAENQVNEGGVSSKSDKISEGVHVGRSNTVDSNNISGPNENTIVQHSSTGTNDPILAMSATKPTNSSEPAKGPEKVPSPFSDDKHAELTVDTTDKEIDDEESPPFSPIGVETTKQSDWNSNSTTTVESSVPVERSSPARLSGNYSIGFRDRPLGILPEDIPYRRSDKMERIRSYSNDEPNRSHTDNSKARSRRKSHPAENVPVDLSHHVKPVFEMKIPPNVPKLDLTGRTPIYHEALDQPPVPYDLIPTTLVRPIPTPPPSFVSPHRPLVVHSIKGSGPIRPIPTLRVASPVAPYAPIASQFTPPDEMSIELSSRMNANHPISAFHSTKKKTNPTFTGPKKVEYNPLLFAHKNNYILNAGLSSVIPSLPSVSTFTNSPSSLVKQSKPRSGRGRTDTASNVTQSTSKMGVVNLRATIPDSTESATRDVRLREAQVQLLITNPELSISRTTSGGNGHSFPKSVSSPDVMALDANPKVMNSSPSGSTDSVSFNNSFLEDERVEVGEIIEPLDVVTCELDEGSCDSLAYTPRTHISGVTITPSTGVKQQASKDIKSEPKKTPVPIGKVQNGDKDILESLRETVTLEDYSPKKKPDEKQPAKATPPPRRRVSILDPHKSCKKNSSNALVTSNFSINGVSTSNTDKKSTLPSSNPMEPRNHVVDSKITTKVERSNLVLPVDSKCSETSLKNIPALGRENKEVVSSTRNTSLKGKLDIAPLDPSSCGVPTLDRVNKLESPSVKPSGAKELFIMEENEETHLLSDGTRVDGKSSLSSEAANGISHREEKVSKSAVIEPVIPSKNKPYEEVDGENKLICGVTESKQSNAVKPVAIGSKIVKVKLDRAADSTKELEQEKVVPIISERGNESKPKETIAEKVSPLKCTNGLDDTLTKPTFKPSTDNKLEETNLSITDPKTDTSKLTKAQLHTQVKTHEIAKASCDAETDGEIAKPSCDAITDGEIAKPSCDAVTDCEVAEPSRDAVTDGKLNQTSIKRTPWVAEKTIPKQEPDSSNLKIAACIPTKTDRIPKSNPEPVKDIKLNEANITLVARVVEASINSDADTYKFTNALSLLKTDLTSVTNPEPLTAQEPHIEVAGRSDSMSKADVHVKPQNTKARTDELSGCSVEPKAKTVEKPALQPKRGGKLDRAIVELTTKLVEKSIIGSETGDVTNKLESCISRPNADDKSNAANGHIEPFVATLKPEVSDHLYCVKIDIAQPNAIIEPILHDENGIVGSVAPNSEINLKTDDQLATKLGFDDLLTYASTKSTDNKLGTVNTDHSALVVLNEQRTGDELDSKIGDINSVEPAAALSSELGEEPINAEDVTLRASGTEIRIEKASDVSSEAGNDLAGPPSTGHRDLKSPPSIEVNEEKSEEMLLKECPLLGKELFCDTPTLANDKELSDHVASTVAESLVEIVKSVSVPCNNVLLEPPAVKDTVEYVSRHLLADDYTNAAQNEKMTKSDLGTDVGSEVAEVKEATCDDDASPNNSRVPEDRHIIKLNEEEPAKQKEETVENISSTNIEPTCEKTAKANLSSNGAIHPSPEEQKEGKNETVVCETVVCDKVEIKDVSEWETVQSKDGGKPSVDSKSLKQKEADKLVITEMVQFTEEENHTSISRSDVVTDVKPPSLTAESVIFTAAEVQTKCQNPEVDDILSLEPLSAQSTNDLLVTTNTSHKELTPEGPEIPCIPYLDAVVVQEGLNDVVGKSALDTEKSIVAKNNDKSGGSPAEPLAADQLSTSTMQEKSHPSSYVSPRNPFECTVVETPPQSPVNIASTEPENTSGSCAPEPVNDVPSKPSVNNPTPTINLTKTDLVVSDVDEKPSSSSMINEKVKNEDTDDILASCDRDRPPKPCHPDQCTLANTYSSCSNLASTAEGSNINVHEPSTRSPLVDSTDEVPSPTAETCAIDQSSESSLPLPSEPIKEAAMKERGSAISSSLNMSSVRPERKRKRPAWWSSEDGKVALKLGKRNAAETPFEVDCPGGYGEKLTIDPSFPKVEVELLCQSVLRKLQENLGISIDHIDLAKLQKCWAEFHSSFNGEGQEERSNQPIHATRKSTERLSAFDIHARPSTSRGSDHTATFHSRASSSLMEDNDHPGRLVEILHERSKLASKSFLERPTKRGEKRTVSEAFAQNVYIYKDPRITGRSTYDRMVGSGRRQLLPYEVPVLPSTPQTRHPPQRSYSWILEHLRERRKRNQHRESSIPAQSCKDFIRLQEEYTRPSLREVYNRYVGEQVADMVGYSRVSAVHELPVPASTPSSSTSRIPTFTISSDSEDSNPGNPEDSVNERDEVRRRIRRKSNTPSISSCSCPQSGHGSNRTTCPSCRNERYHAPGGFSPIRSSQPSLYTEITHVERQESARVRGKRAATVVGGDDPVTVLDSDAAVRRLKSLLSTAWPSDLDTLNDDPPIRDSFTSYQEDVSLPQVTVSPCPPPQSSSSAHPPPGMERVAGATFQRCLQQKPFSERGRQADNNDNVQPDSVISTECPTVSLSQAGISPGLQSCVPCFDGPPAKKKKS